MFNNIKLLFLFHLLSNVSANFIAFSGSKCDGVGGSIVAFTGCTNLDGRHSFKFVDNTPYSSTTYISLWADSGCNGNENGYKNAKTNQCYNIDTGGRVMSGRAYDYCHVQRYSFPAKSCPDINDKHAVKRDEADAEDLIITEVDDSNSNPVYLFDNYELGFNETVNRLSGAGALQLSNTPFVEDDNSTASGTNVPEWLFNQIVSLSTV